MEVLNMKALAIIFDGFEECEAVSPFALLRRANIELTITSDKNEIACFSFPF